MDEANREISMARDYAWKYFELHANQRMSTFNFFLILSGLVLAGLAGCVAGGDKLRTPGIGLAIGLSIVSIIFFKLDQRVSFLLKRAEDALSELEISLPLCARLFRDEPAATEVARRQEAIWTYGKSFRGLFLVTFLVGPIAVIVMLR